MTELSRSRVLLAAGLAALGLTFAVEAPAEARVHTVVIDKMRFGAVPGNVRAGDVILWVNKDIFKHTATARDKSFTINLPPQRRGRTTIKKAGTIPFFCIYHPGMKGVLQVRK